MRAHPEHGPAVDAILLTGGRASRLGGTPKHTLRVGDSTLLATTLNALDRARRIVIVGRAGDVDASPRRILTTRESPAYAGPAAALAAGLAALDADWRSQGLAPAAAVLALACDMPRIGEVTPQLFDRAQGLHAHEGVGSDNGPDGWLAVDRGRRQPLAAVYRPAPLGRAIDRLRADSGLTGASLRSLLAPLDLAELTVADGACDDCDTWQDIRRLRTTSKGPS